MPDYRAQVREFVTSSIGDAGLGDDVDLYASWRVSPLFAVRLVMWVEQRFGIAVGGADLDIANFRSITAVAEFVSSRADGSQW